MKKTLVAILGTVAYGLSFGQTINVGNHVTMKFPSDPDIEQSGNKTLYIITDSTYIINVTFADMKNNPNFSITSDQLKEFYRGVINGTLDAAADSKLVSETIINFGKYEGREIKYTKDFNGIDDIPVTKRILLVNKSVYIFDIWDLSKKGQKNLEKQIFESITVQ
jgi:hypothetical protein